MASAVGQAAISGAQSALLAKEAAGRAPCQGQMNPAVVPRSTFVPRTIGSTFLVGTAVPMTSSSQSARSSRSTINAVASERKPAKAVSGNANPASDDSAKVAANIKYHAEFSPAYKPLEFNLKAAYRATAQSLRDSLVQRWNDTYALWQKLNPKQTYYLSMEFLQGRALLNAVGNLGVEDAYARALEKLGYDLEAVVEQEPDAALGNGGLGRLASCFLDSMATLNYPAWGYGLRYKHGLFKQLITKEGQEEVAEDWLEMGNPWEIPRFDVAYPIRFFGKVENGKWVGGEKCQAVAYDVPIPGYKTKNCISLRLWQAKAPPAQFDLAAFNAGEHDKAVHDQVKADEINLVLYPGDGTRPGKLLRLKQQYTLCSASLQDILARFKERNGAKPDWSLLPEKVAVQMNDTHPTLCIPELIRLLVDNEGVSWKQAREITTKVCAYTNHTVLPEALEKWPLDLVEELLPRHLDIIRKIDDEFVQFLIGTDKAADKATMRQRIAATRILENIEFPGYEEEEETEEEEKPAEKDAKDSKAAAAKPKNEKPAKPAPAVRMANLCVISAHAVNGVAEIHSEIVKDDVFNDFYKLWPEKFQNKTNGVTPRRWLSFCNPDLSAVITKWLKTDEWVENLDLLAGLRQHADNPKLQEEWAAAKLGSKKKLAAYVKEKTGITISTDAMFDIQIKRIHEYKRQLMNIMGIIYRYKKMKEMTPEERKKVVPRVCMFGGKAFATYWQAKRIVRLVTDVGAVVNNDPEIGDLLKVVMVPDYNVSVAEQLIPASELSQHISTAGMEASGTSNMKFAMNGCLIIGTLDGANVEIREEIGEENFFLFGAYAHEIKGLRADRAAGKFKPDPRFEEVKKYIRAGTFGKYDFEPLLDSLEGNEGFGRGDYFLVGHDFPAYLECQKEVDKAYQDQKKWTKMSILSTAGSGKFSSDRTIHQYAKEIWNIKPAAV